MPYALTLSLDLSRHTNLPPNAVPSLHRGIFQWLDEAYAGLGHTVHAWGNQADAPAYKPFTVAPMQVADEIGRVPVTLLSDDIFRELSQGSRQHRFVEINYQGVPLCEDPRTERFQSYATLATKQGFATQLVLQFLSPTCFRVKRRNMPLPVAANVFESYALKWNTFAPAQIDAVDATWLKGWVETHVEVQRCEVQTIAVPFHQVIGFVGRVEYAINLSKDPSSEDAAGLLWLNRLADYAGFCGTGRLCAQGMGHTQRLHQWTS
jgi:CRISPR-associated endoribonuclease Cas6